MITIGDKVRVCWTGDDQLDWAAGLEGEVIDTRKITVPSGVWEYSEGSWNGRRPLYYTFHQVTVRTAQGEVTVNSDEVTRV